MHCGIAVFLAGLVAFTSADNVDTVIEGFIGALNKMDIPSDRKATYKVLYSLYFVHLISTT